VQTADKIYPKLQNKRDWRLCPPTMKQNTTKQLCVCMAVYEFLTALLALELALTE